MKKSAKLTQTGIEGLDLILGNISFPPLGMAYGCRLLIRGLPGTGKTTLGLHLFHHQLVELCSQQGEGGLSSGLIMSFLEAPGELDRIAFQFGLDFKDCPPDIAVLKMGEFTDFGFTQTWIDEREGKDYLCILIDGLSILKSQNQNKLHKSLATLLTKIRMKNLFLIIIAEEDITGQDHFFEHMVDGVINLNVDDSPHRHRYLEITKLRYIDYVRGRHGFDMHQNIDGSSTLEVYPNPACHFIRLVAKQDSANRRVRQSPKKTGIAGAEEGAESPGQRPKFRCGIIGLGGIIHGTKTSDGPELQAGDVFLVTAEAGTDKISMGLSFLSPITSQKGEKGLWLSFGPSSLARVFSREAYTDRFNELVSLYWRSNHQGSDQDTSRFDEICCASGVFHPDQVVANLMHYLTDNADYATRVVVDGLTNIGRELNDQSKVVEYTIWLARLLAKSKAVSLLLVDLSQAFQPIGDIPMEWEAEADFVGHLRWFEINNQLNLTFVLTKSRYSTFKSVPHYINYVRDKAGIELEDRGCPMINMLSGQMAEVQEAKVFLKFFDQNYSTRQVHRPVFDEFKRRYSRRDQIFIHVYRILPSPEHWSFRGYAGAGHSNTKIVCLRQHIMEVLKSDKVLVQIPDEEWKKYLPQTDAKPPEKEYLKARSYSLWGLARRGDPKPCPEAPDQIIPLFADLGVLCSQLDWDNLTDKAEKECQAGHAIKFIETSFPKEIKVPRCWQELFEMNRKFREVRIKQDTVNSKSVNAPKVWYYPQWIDHLFALPDKTSDFMAFFLELLIDFSDWDQDTCFEQLTSYGLSPLIKHRAFDDTIKFLRRLVIEGVSRTPLEKTHYHTAFFSRRWFSRIDQYPLDDPRLPDIEKYLQTKRDPDFDPKKLKIRFKFRVDPLPTHKREEDGQPRHSSGVSCLDFYSLGVIKGALAPETAWMFISELASTRTDINRFENRRGLPILRENWVVPKENPMKENPVRMHDREVIDQIIDKKRFFCNFWIQNRYWYLESDPGIQRLLRNIFIEVESKPLEDITTVLEGIRPTTDELRKDFCTILEEIDKKREEKLSH